MNLQAATILRDSYVSYQLGPTWATNSEMFFFAERVFGEKDVDELLKREAFMASAAGVRLLGKSVGWKLPIVSAQLDFLVRTRKTTQSLS